MHCLFCNLQAVAEGNEACTLSLIEAEASIDMQDKSGYTALMLVSLLLETRAWWVTLKITCFVSIFCTLKCMQCFKIKTHHSPFQIHSVILKTIKA